MAISAGHTMPRPLPCQVETRATGVEREAGVREVEHLGTTVRRRLLHTRQAVQELVTGVCLQHRPAMRTARCPGMPNACTYKNVHLPYLPSRRSASWP